MSVCSLSVLLVIGCYLLSVRLFVGCCVLFVVCRLLFVFEELSYKIMNDPICLQVMESEYQSGQINKKHFRGTESLVLLLQRKKGSDL